MTTTKKGQMLHKKSNVFGRVPSASTLGFGEIAVNYNEKEPFLAIKTSGETNNFEVVKFSSDKIIEQKINDAVDKVGSELNELADIVSQNELVTADSLTELNDAINHVGSKFSDYATSADTSSAIKAVSAATFAAIKAVNDKADALSDTVNDAVSSLTETINNKVSSAYIYKGSKKTYNELPTTGNNKGDVWNVEGANGNVPAGTNYAWDGSKWDALAGIVDLTIYATSAATFATIKAVNDKTDALSDTVVKTTPQTLSDTDKNQVKENLGISTPDWNAKEGEDGYIKNRTHYKDVEIFENGGLKTNDDGEPISPNYIRFRNEYGNLSDLIIVDDYTDGLRIEGNPLYDEYGDTVEYIYGTLLFQPDNWAIRFTPNGDGIYYVDSVYESFKQLDEEFIPDTIARAEQLTELHEEIAKKADKENIYYFEWEGNEEPVADYLTEEEIEKIANADKVVLYIPQEGSLIYPVGCGVQEALMIFSYSVGQMVIALMVYTNEQRYELLPFPSYNDTDVKTKLARLEREKADKSDIVTPDWDAQEGEAGYIENRTHYVTGTIETINLNGEWSITKTNIIVNDDSIIDISWNIDFMANHTEGSCRFTGTDESNSYSFDNDGFHIDFQNHGGLIDLDMWAFGGADPHYGTVTIGVDFKYKTLDEVYIPDTVVKTTPQTLSDTDKNQALTNLGLTDIAKKSELDEVYSSAVTNTNVQISEFYFNKVFNLKYEQSDNTVYYKGTYGENEWTALPIWLLNRHLAYALDGGVTITTNMIITSGSSFPQVINDFKIYPETNNYRPVLSWNYDGKKYILTFDGNGPQGQNIVVEQIGGGSNGSGINPEYDSGSRAYVVGVDDDGNAYYSDVYMSGNTLNAPNGFFQQSDENLKIFISDIEVDLEKITQLPKKYFMWLDKRDENVHLGTSAQAVQELYPEIVRKDKNGNLTVDYSKLSVIALRAIDVLNEERKQMKADIAEIKNKLGL